MFAPSTKFLRLTPLSYRQGCLSMQLWNAWIMAEYYYGDLIRRLPLQIKPRVRSWADGDDILVVVLFNGQPIRLASINWPRQSRMDGHPRYDVPELDFSYHRLIPRKVNHAVTGATP